MLPELLHKTSGPKYEVNWLGAPSINSRYTNCTEIHILSCRFTKITSQVNLEVSGLFPAKSRLIYARHFLEGPVKESHVSPLLIG